MQTARAVERNAAKQIAPKTQKGRSKVQAEDQAKDVQESTHRSPSPPLHRQQDFVPVNTSQPKRLNDIAQAPPEFKKLPRGASAFSSKKDAGLSMAQKLMMEKERENAIARYRALKANRQQSDTAPP